MNEQINQQINHKLHTSCKDCLFAEYTEKTQSNCSLGMLSKLRQHNVEILDVYDEEKEFNIINNSKCVHKRTSSWIHAQDSLAVQKDQVKEETHLRFHTLILLRPDSTFVEVEKTLRSLTEQLLKPEYITIVRPAENVIPPNQLTKLCQSLCDNPTILWRVENIVQPLDKVDVYKLILPFVKSNIYSIFYASFEVPNVFLFDVSTKVVDGFAKFMMLLPNSAGNGLVGLKTVYKYYMDRAGSLEEKLRKDGCPEELLISVSKFLPYFPE